VETVSDHLLGEAEEPGDEEPDLSEWGEEEWEMAKKVIASETTFKKHPSFKNTPKERR
jgi:hypothetical protein